MMKKSVDVAVIGAGPNGLICSAYLARAGLDVILLEKRHETGGGLDTLEFSGFKFNTHAVYHLMANIMPPYFDFDLGKKGVRYLFPEVQAAYLSDGNPPLLFYRSPEKTCRHIAASFSTQEAEKYQRMYDDFREFSEKILIPLTYVPPLPALDMVQLLSNAKDDIGRRFNEIAEMTPLEIIGQYGFQEPLQAAVLNLFTMWGLSPQEAIGYLLPLYVYRMTDAALCVGGSHRLSSALHKTVIQEGATISDMSEVVKIRLENGKASGVILADGTEITAQAVISTVDPHQNFLTFFDETEIPANLVQDAHRWEWEKITFFGAHLAMREAPRYRAAEGAGFPDVNRALITYLGASDTDELLDYMATLEAGKLPEKLHGHATCPSLFDPIQAFEDFHTGRFETLVPYDCDWEAIKEEYAEKCVGAWRRQAPNLDPLFVLHYPPTYIEKKNKSMVRGSFKHGAYRPLQMGYFRPNATCSQAYTPIEGFYVCGASAYPGGMILGGGGYIGANTVTEDFGLGKKWNEPEMLRHARESGLLPG